MFLSMCVSLYTSRVVLNTLGIVDFGIYNVVGGVVAMFSFLNSSMSGATSRFFAYEIGRKDTIKLKETFSSALINHILIALIIFLLAETIGLWFLEYKLVIPIDRMNAARWVYQTSVFSTIIGVTQVPYNASIISHEKMNVYAYVEILNVSLKLIIIYLLVIGNFDKLILYSMLVLFVSFIIAFIYRFYCIKKFAECRFKWMWRPEIMKPMLTFSGWDLYGNASTVARTQGINMLLNIFFGATINAASGIATSVQGVVMSFGSNVIMAVKPQIIKSYASKEYGRVISLVNNASKFTFLLMLIISLPLMLEMEFVLRLWLGVVPKYAVVFCEYTLLFNFFSTMSFVVVTAIHATGNIKRPSLINGTLYLSVIPLAYIAYKTGFNPEFAYIFNVLAIIIGMLSNVYTIKLYIKNFPFWYYIRNVFLSCILVMLISGFSSLAFQYWFGGESWQRLIYTTFVSIMTVSISGFYILMNKNMRHQVVCLVKKRICKKV